MKAITHFAVGMSVGVLLVTLFDLRAREEFVAVFLSGIWAMVPDGHWLFREMGVTSVAVVWRRFHQSSLANLCWFHRVLDTNETARPNVEAAMALLVLAVSIGIYYRYNDWTIS